MPNGRRWNRCAWVSRAIPGAVARTTDCLSKRCFGLRAPVVRDATCRRRSDTGTVPSRASAIGSKADVFKRLFDTVSDDPDMEYAMVDATIVKVHRAWTGRKRGTSGQAIGRSKGDMTNKILALTHALGNLVRFVLLSGQRFDTVGVPPLLDGIEFGALIVLRR